MSLTTARLNLIHTCTIERAASAARDGWNQKPPADWAPHLTRQVCRVWTTSGREAVDANTDVVVEDIRMILPLGTDVTETDRVGDVTYRGATILPGPTSIRAVMHNHTHLELVLVRVS